MTWQRVLGYFGYVVAVFYSAALLWIVAVEWVTWRGRRRRRKQPQLRLVTNELKRAHGQPYVLPKVKGEQ